MPPGDLVDSGGRASGDGVDDRVEGAAGKGAVSVRAFGGAAGLLSGSACWRFQASRNGPGSMLNVSAVNLRDRSAAWQKTGWKSFDPASTPYGADEVRKERQLHAGALY